MAYPCPVASPYDQIAPQPPLSTKMRKRAYPIKYELDGKRSQQNAQNVGYNKNAGVANPAHNPHTAPHNQPGPRDQ